MIGEFVSLWDGDIEISTSCEIDVTTRKVTDIESVDGIDDDGEEVENLEDQYVRVGDLKFKALSFDDFQDLWIEQECEKSDDNEELKAEIAACNDFEELFHVVGLWSHTPVIQRVTAFLERNDACYFEN